MVSYETVKEEIRRADNRRPQWIQKQIAYTDRWLWELEELNKRGLWAAPQVRRQLKLYASEVMGVSDYLISETGNHRRSLRAMTCDPTDMLDLVYDLQERLFEEDGRRRNRELYGDEEPT